MTELVSCLSTGKGTWGHVSRIIQSNDWSKVVLVTNSFGKEKFTAGPNLHFVVIDPDEGFEALKKSMMEQLKPALSGPEVALNMVSGSGREHMALLSSLLGLGLGIRLVAFDNDNLIEL